VQLWVGLGNPGAAHAQQRHNVGFMAADVIHAVHRFSPWKVKHKGLIADGMIRGEKILLLKPQTFMNDSGRSVGEAMRFFKLEPADVTVFYDELDLAPFKVKVKTGGGAAGHNGIRSTMAHIGEDFRRVRIGIGHAGHKDRVLGYVLGNYAKAEIEPLTHMLGVVADEATWLAGGDDVRFMNDVAMRTGPV
jgi:peptidyl-tRNA hydrolase, PTH1 family